MEEHYTMEDEFTSPYSTELRVILEDDRYAMREVLINAGKVQTVYWDDDGLQAYSCHNSIEEMKAHILAAFDKPVVEVTVREVK